MNRFGFSRNRHQLIKVNHLYCSYKNTNVSSFSAFHFGYLPNLYSGDEFNSQWSSGGATLGWASTRQAGWGARRRLARSPPERRLAGRQKRLKGGQRRQGGEEERLLAVDTSSHAVFSVYCDNWQLMLFFSYFYSICARVVEYFILNFRLKIRGFWTSWKCQISPGSHPQVSNICARCRGR